MHLYQADNEAAFLVLYRRYAGKVHGFLLKRLRDSAAAADICQTVFIKLHASRSLYHATLPFAPWLFAITRNALIDWQRVQKSQSRFLEYDVAIDEVAAADEVSAEQDVEAQVIPLNRLPQLQRNAIEMRYAEDLPFDDIAERLGTSPNNARQLVSRGIRKLRTLFPTKEKKA